jgi:hypothetical protein
VTSPPLPPGMKITVIRERPRKARARPTTDEEDEDDEEREDAERDEEFAPQKARGCTFTGLGCLVLLGFPLVVWLLA